jgi:hypothetical protein
MGAGVYVSRERALALRPALMCLAPACPALSVEFSGVQLGSAQVSSSEV